MKVLLLYPAYPATFFSFSHALKFVGKKAAVSPLGIITVSAMLPKAWNKRLVDLNIQRLEDADIQWADWIFISAMYVQKESVKDLLKRCGKFQKRIIAGGPLFNWEHEKYPVVDHFALNEGEITLKMLLDDFQNDIPLKPIYKAKGYADITKSPVPDYHLLDLNAYASINIQFTRGCPYSCDFCEIPSYLGHQIRTKSKEQIQAELTAIYQLGWRGSISIVDDNFIGNRKVAKTTILPILLKWMQEHQHPYVFNNQTSLDLVDDPDLMKMMVGAGINNTFIGIESPAPESILEGNKTQNKKRDILNCIWQIQGHGLIVMGGFIIGFDNDPPDIFEQQAALITKSGIVWAMVGLLNAPKGTPLYNRMALENRLTIEATGSNTDYSMNFIPKMDEDQLKEAYRTLIRSLYAPKAYSLRIRQLFVNYKKGHASVIRIQKPHVFKIVLSFFVLGFLDKGRWSFWNTMVWTVFHKPVCLIDAYVFLLTGYHFRRTYGL